MGRSQTMGVGYRSRSEANGEKELRREAWSRRASDRPGSSPHAPRPGAVQRILGGLQITGAFWYRFHRWGISILPEWGIRAGISVFTAVFFVLLRRVRTAIASNLEVALGPCGWLERQRRIHSTMHQLAWCLTERYEWLNGVAMPEQTRLGLEHLEAARCGEGGVVAVTAHLGHWELASVGYPGRPVQEVHVVRDPEMNPRAQRMMQRLMRQAAPGLVVHFNQKDPRLGAELLGVLRDGGLVALQGDRPAPGGRSVELRLFGRPFRVPVGPFALARAAGVSVLPVFAIRAGRRRTIVRIHAPIGIHRSDSSDPVKQAARAFVELLQTEIQGTPHQWFCFSSLWCEESRPQSTMTEGETARKTELARPKTSPDHRA